MDISTVLWVKRPKLWQLKKNLRDGETRWSKEGDFTILYSNNVPFIKTRMKKGKDGTDFPYIPIEEYVNAFAIKEVNKK